MSLKDLKQRIATVQSTQKITKAMQMVAASKLNKSRLAAEQSKAYAELMGSIVSDVVASLSLEGLKRSLLFGAEIVSNVLLVVVTSDRGLCGAYNTNILRMADKVIADHEHNAKQVTIITIGKKAYDHCRRKHSAKILRNYSGITGKAVDYEKSAILAEELIADFAAAKFDKCELIYSNFKSVIAQVPITASLIPADIKSNARDQLNLSAGYTFDPSQVKIVDQLIPENIKVQLHSALLEADASEHAARMTSMDSATRNCGDMIGSLKVLYNRTRQAQITKELIEIISGAEAM